MNAWAVVATPDIDAVLAASTAERHELDDLKRQHADAMHQLDVANEARRRAERELSTMLRLDKARPAEPPKWMRSPRKASAHSGTPWLLTLRRPKR